MFYSKAYLELSASAMRTLQRCLQKRNWGKEKVNGKKRVVYYNDPFVFPYSEAAFLNIKSTQFWKNLRKLIEAGFIDIVHQGGWYQKDERHKDYSVYCLSERWRHYGTDQFKKVEKPKVLQKDFYVRENIRRQRTKPTSQKRSGHLHDSEDDRPKKKNIRLHESEVSESLPNTPETLTCTG